MILGIDGQLLVGNKTGMGVVLHNVLKLLSLPSNIEKYLFLNGTIDNEMIEEFKNRNIECVCMPKCNYFKWEQIVIPKLAKKYRIDLFWFPNNTASLKINCKTIVTIHDLIYMQGSVFSPPTIYKKIGKIYRRYVVKKIINKTNRIISISNSTKDDILKRFPKVKNKISVVLNGCEYDNSILDNYEYEEFKKRNNIDRNFILAFGSIEKRKNTMNIIKAFEKISDSYDGKLVLFGFRNYDKSKEYKYIKKNKVKNIIILGYISQKEKNSLYKNCDCFVFPSFDEGFGLPVLEAYKNGAKVVLSNISSLREIGGDLGFYVNPQEVLDISEGMVNAIKSNNNDYSYLANNWVKRFDWSVSTKKIEEIILEIFGTNYENTDC